jgi:hypothetical protein
MIAGLHRERRPPMSIYRIFNQGEIARLADGWRSVIALAPGRKWITILDWTTLETARLPLDLWERLHRDPRAAIRRAGYVRPSRRGCDTSGKRRPSAPPPLCSNDRDSYRAAVARVAAARGGRHGP